MDQNIGLNLMPSSYIDQACVWLHPEISCLENAWGLSSYARIPGWTWADPNLVHVKPTLTNEEINTSLSVMVQITAGLVVF